MPMPLACYEARRMLSSPRSVAMTRRATRLPWNRPTVATSFWSCGYGATSPSPDAPAPPRGLRSRAPGRPAILLRDAGTKKIGAR